MVTNVTDERLRGVLKSGRSVDEAFARYAGTARSADASIEVPRTLDKGIWLLEPQFQDKEAVHERNNPFIFGQLHFSPGL
jgi:hypothetical protein